MDDLLEIQILSQLRDKKLKQFKDQAGFNLQPTDKTSSDPVLRYIISWLIDAQQRELTRKPTWRNFIQVLEEIELGEVAKKIEEFFNQTCPDGSQQKKGKGKCTMYTRLFDKVSETISIVARPIHVNFLQKHQLWIRLQRFTKISSLCLKS